MGRDRGFRARGRQPFKGFVHVVTESVQTEQRYFRLFCRKGSGLKPRIKVVSFGQLLDWLRRGDLLGLREAGWNPKRGDVLWFVCDKDTKPDAKLKELLTLAGKHSIRVAVSNRSFELWLLLHFEDVTVPLDQNQLETRLASCLGSAYDKTDYDAGKFRGLTADACSRAKKLPLGRHGFPNNPGSAVWAVIEDIKKKTTEP